MPMDETLRVVHDSAERFLSAAYPFEARERLRLNGGFSQEVWRSFADSGWLMVGIPEADGGIGDSAAVVATLAQAMGRALLLEPWLGSAVLATRALSLAGDNHQRSTWLPALMDGSIIAALAYNETNARGFPDHIETWARRCSGGYRLTGRKLTVLGAPVSDLFIISARTASADVPEIGVGLFVVPAGTGGLERHALPLLDGRLAGEIVLNDVFVGTDACLGDPGNGLSALEGAIAFGLIAQAADNVGAMEKSCELTANHLKTRQQFGGPLSSLQVLQHRMAEMATALECAKSMIDWAISRLTAGAGLAELGSVKAYVNKAARFVTGNGIQLHGAIGFTEEYPVGHYYKRVITNDALLGSGQLHLSSYADWLAAKLLAERQL